MIIRTSSGLFNALIFVAFFASVQDAATKQVGLSVEVEEEVYSYVPANNGADPLWDLGSTNVVRIGEQVFVTASDTLKSLPPLNNTRCRLLRRDRTGWTVLESSRFGRTREPCPIVALVKQGKVLVSDNPAMNPPGVAGPGPARPTVLEFSVKTTALHPQIIYPAFHNVHPTPFSEHSYRSFSADQEAGEWILFQNVAYSHTEWTLQSERNKPALQGALNWALETGSGRVFPLRTCYPNVALRNRELHFVGVSDVVEPNQEWRNHKKDLTRDDSDYVFRRLLYAWTPNIGRQAFAPWLELANRERTAGRIRTGDLWVDRSGRAHIVWEEAALDVRLRDKFFPSEKQRFEVNYAVVSDGKVVTRRTLVAIDEGQAGAIPHLPRLHVTSDGRLFAFFYVNGTDDGGKSISENRIMELRRDGTVSTAVRVPLSRPLDRYMTATPRAGTAPSDFLELLGSGPTDPLSIRYARVRIAP